MDKELQVSEEDIDRLKSESSTNKVVHSSAASSLASDEVDPKKDSSFKVEKTYGDFVQLRPLGEDSEDLNNTGRFDFTVRKSLVEEGCKKGDLVAEDKSTAIKAMIQGTMRDVANSEDIQLTDKEIALAVILAVKNGGFSNAKSEVMKDLENIGFRKPQEAFEKMARFSVAFQREVEAFTGNENELELRAKEGTLEQLTRMRLKRVPLFCLEGIVSQEEVEEICKIAGVDLESLKTKPAPVPSKFTRDANAKAMESAHTRVVGSDLG